MNVQGPPAAARTVVDGRRLLRNDRKSGERSSPLHPLTERYFFFGAAFLTAGALLMRASMTFLT